MEDGDEGCSLGVPSKWESHDSTCPTGGDQGKHSPVSSPGKAPNSRFCFALGQKSEVMHLESRWQQGIFHVNV